MILHCDDCNKDTEHIPYSEGDTFRMGEVDVPYEDMGYICTKCGCETCTPEQSDAIMNDIRETWSRMRGY